jgi:hypothetical protein
VYEWRNSNVDTHQTPIRPDLDCVEAQHLSRAKRDQCRRRLRRVEDDACVYGAAVRAQDLTKVTLALEMIAKSQYLHKVLELIPPAFVLDLAIVGPWRVTPDQSYRSW